MPKAYTLDRLPKPLHERVKLRAVPVASYAVIRFSGLWTEGNYQRHLQKLQQAMAEQGLDTTGEPVYARYNAPYMPWFLRRNEI